MTDVADGIEGDADPAALPEARPFARGADVIRAAVRTMPDQPGVYRMLNGRGDALYVGKAKSLPKRVVSYTRTEGLPIRLRRMVAETHDVEVVTTGTEAEALLLESDLIKKLKPRYNILLRDDKSFPYIRITTDQRYPRITKYRGARAGSGEFYGPFASAGSVNQTLTLLQKAFLLRSCNDSVFANRSRPCLLYQIKRCSAPCVDYISQGAYAALLDQARQFLTGRSTDIQKTLAARMEEAAARMAFEEAAVYRDRIRALARITTQQDIALPEHDEADVLAVHVAGGQACVQVFFFRAGRNYGNRAFFPAHTQDATPEEVLTAFVGQFYASRQPPRSILLSHDPETPALLAEALGQRAGRKVYLLVPKRGDRRRIVEQVAINAREALERRMAESATQNRLLAGVAEVFDLEAPPARIEVYDNSHTGGTEAVGGMIVAGPEGLIKNAYRKFNIRSEDLAPGDDFGMMREVMRRRFGRALREDPDRAGGQWPDLVVIDGGRGQLSAATAALQELGVLDLPLVAISKGQDRNAGREQFHLPDRPTFLLPPNHPVLYFMQRLRDEAHRFAIGSHRARRSKAVGRSALDAIPGIGAARKKALLHHFGSVKGIEAATVDDLTAVGGISRALARRIHGHFHGS